MNSASVIQSWYWNWPNYDDGTLGGAIGFGPGNKNFW